MKMQSVNGASPHSWIEIYLSKADEDGYVPFNEDRRLGQNQYASRLATGKHGSLALGPDLRWKNLENGDYHSIRIHADDLVIFHERALAYHRDTMRGESKDLSQYLALSAHN